jgi:hypothetical protein
MLEDPIIERIKRPVKAFFFPPYVECPPVKSQHEDVH